MSLKEKVKELRTKKGWNQKQLAEATGISQATISRIEDGSIKQIKSEALRKLAEKLDTSIDFLTGKTSELSENDVINADKRAKKIFRGFSGFSENEKNELVDFVDWLENKRKKKSED